MDLEYEKIYSCPNDCILYWDENANEESYNICGSSQWASYKEDEGDVLSEMDATQSKKKSTKVLCYFPLISRLKRIYTSSKIALLMR